MIKLIKRDYYLTCLNLTLSSVCFICNKFISGWNIIVRVIIVLNRTVVTFQQPMQYVNFRINMSCVTSVDGLKLWLLTLLS